MTEVSNYNNLFDYEYSYFIEITGDIVYFVVKIKYLIFVKIKYLQK